MPTADQPMPAIEIMPPNGRVERPERRCAPAFRPYSSLDGRSPGSPSIVADRRRRRRAVSEQALGRRLDIES